MDIQIRHAGDRDGPLITGFTRAALQDMESVGGHETRQDEGFWLTHAEKIVESIGKDDRLYLLAQSGYRIVGFVEGRIVKLHEVFIRQKIFHIAILYVIPESRRHGIATSLVKKVLGWAWDQGCREADLNVLINNEIWLYRKPK